MTATTDNKARKPRHVRSCLLIGLSIGMSAAVYALPAQAQLMDYGSLEQLFGEPVTTSATGSPQRATEVPANMIIITADDIRRSGARDIPGVLRHVAGVDVMQWASDNADISIRGYNQAYAARTLVLIDGRQVYADYYGFVPWSALPIELGAIRQIEIVKGPNAALFGFNAVGGVINIVTYNPRYDDVSTVSTRVGTQGLAEVSGVATLPLGSIGALRLSGGLRSDDEFTTPIPLAMAGPPRVANGRTSIDADATFKLSSGVDLGVEASHTHARQNEVSPDYTSQDSDYSTNSLKAQLAADTNVGLLKLTAYSNWISWHGIANPLLGIFSVHNQVTVVQAEDVFNLGSDHTLRAALEYRHNTVGTAPIAGGTVAYDVASASGMWNWRVTPTVSLTNALRVDDLILGRSGFMPADYPFTNEDWDRSIAQFSFNSGVVWTVDHDSKLRLMISRGVQLPNLVESGALLIDTPFLQVTGSPTLKPTAVTNYELAWDHDLPTFDAHLQLSAFHQYTNNLTSIAGAFVPRPTSLYATSANIGSSSANGIELIANGTMEGAWRWSLSYRAEFIGDTFLPFAKGGIDFVDYEHTTPKHVAKGNIGWSDDRWEIDTYLSYQSGAFGLRTTGIDTYLVPVAAYASLDGRVAYHLTDWATISVSGQNLLQSTQQQTSGPYVERQVFVTLTLSN
ncbi:MAG: TonB-dependent receptor [Alphaproteobacteria bacterium]|nr:TonB-dependent receptor [Alphaproteobacteria bacterium]MDE2110164.1 TonB-dependent receptor [Alphaproteobacteria bacterium]MDE2492498.1 TonB-dependent receptor [Alphaproteobacteria bacterium]